MKTKILIFALLTLIIFGGCKKSDSSPVDTPALFTVTTTSITGITSTNAQSGGSVTSDGNPAITARGVCWSVSANPTIASNKTIDGTGTGSFTSSITGLTANTTYNVRAYATGSTGTVYGSNVIFTTPKAGTTITDIDGNVYNTVKIGSQVWMAENLKVSKYRNGDDIPEMQVASTGEGAWNTLFPYDTYNTIYGKLYTWHAVNDARGLAPLGWHVPSDAEWTTLINYLGGEPVAGGKMKSTTLWVSPNTGATNSSGFTALPGGIYYWFDSWDTFGYWGYWWSSSQGGENAATRYLRYNGNDVTVNYENKGNAVSVRCIKD